MIRIAVLVSGGGTNFQALLDAKARGEIPDGEIVLVVSSVQDAYALTRAEQAGIESCVLRRKGFDAFADFDAAMLETLAEKRVDLVVLAGYLAILGPAVLRAYEGRIVNVHPALIPSFCGKGYYGLRVHEAALQAGVKVTGATVHLVNEVVDGGKILLQQAVPVLEGDTPERLQRRVMEEAEWVLLPRAVSELCTKMKSERGNGNG